MINGLYVYRDVPVWSTTQSHIHLFTNTSFTPPFIHCWHSILPKENLDTGGDRTTHHLVSGRHTLPPEPQPPPIVLSQPDCVVWILYSLLYRCTYAVDQVYFDSTAENKGHEKNLWHRLKKDAELYCGDLRSGLQAPSLLINNNSFRPGTSCLFFHFNSSERGILNIYSLLSAHNSDPSH